MTDPTGAELKKVVLAEIREARREITKLQVALNNLERAAAKPGSTEAKTALKSLHTWMLNIVESHIVLTRLLAGIMEAQQAVRELKEMGEKYEGKITVKDLGIGADILRGIGGPGIGGGRYGRFGRGGF